MIGAVLFVVGCAVLLGAIKNCSPERRRRFHNPKGRQDL